MEKRRRPSRPGIDCWIVVVCGGQPPSAVHSSEAQWLLELAYFEGEDPGFHLILERLNRELRTEN
jgi:hypothetical protein